MLYFKGVIVKMTEQLERIKELQEVLAKKYEIESHLTELPASLDNSKESLDRFRKDYNKKKNEYEQYKTEIIFLQNELADSQKHREELEKNMDSITTHREYELLDKQIKLSQEEEEKKRQNLQKTERNLVELDDLLKSEEELISATENDVKEAQKNLDHEIASYQSQINALGATEAYLSEDIDAETVIKFQRIIRRNKKGIVAVRRNVCDGCHMVLPAQFANKVRHGDSILFCPYCSRILYYEGSPDNDETYFSLADNISRDDSEEDLIEGEDLFSEDQHHFELDESGLGGMDSSTGEGSDSSASSSDSY